MRGGEPRRPRAAANIVATLLAVGHLAGVLALLPADALAQRLGFAPPTAAAPTVTFSPDARAHPVRFALFRDTRMFLPMRVNGVETDAIFDSGASMTTLDTAFAKSLGVSPDTRNGMYASNVTVVVGPMKLSGLTVMVIDLSATSRTIGRPIKAVLGREVLDRGILDIDFAARTFHFYGAAGFHAPPEAVRLNVARAAMGQSSVPISIEGRKPEPADIDIGSSSPLAISADYSDREQLLSGRRVTDVATSGVGGGLNPHALASFRAVTVAGVTFRDVPAIISRSAIDAPPKGAILGFPVLSRFRLVFDYPEAALYLTPNRARVDQPFDRDRSGLRTVLANDRLNVVFISKGSPAEAAGWRVGDAVVAINGRRIGPDYYLGPDARWQMGPPGHVVTLTLADGSRRRLTLADYY